MQETLATSKDTGVQLILQEYDFDTGAITNKCAYLTNYGPKYARLVLTRGNTTSNLSHIMGQPHHIMPEDLYDNNVP